MISVFICYGESHIKKTVPGRPFSMTTRQHRHSTSKQCTWHFVSPNIHARTTRCMAHCSLSRQPARTMNRAFPSCRPHTRCPLRRIPAWSSRRACIWALLERRRSPVAGSWACRVSRKGNQDLAHLSLADQQRAERWFVCGVRCLGRIADITLPCCSSSLVRRRRRKALNEIRRRRSDNGSLPSFRGATWGWA